MSGAELRLIGKRYGLFYLGGLIIIGGLKYYYSQAGVYELAWILAPTIRCVKLLSGITFTLDPQVGYINNHFQFIIAPACSGVQFMIITFAALFYPFVHRMGTMGRSCRWLAISLGASYCLTIFVNSLRIIFSVYILFYLPAHDLAGGWITPERVHLALGVILYCTSLFVIYHLAEYAVRKIAWPAEKNRRRSLFSDGEHSCGPRVYQYLPPLFCYLAVTLGVPALNGAYRNNRGGFTVYALLIMVICLALYCLFYLASVLRRRYAGYQAGRSGKGK
ncbi:MAG: exosortase K [Firmicutes bacterium]|nr:exosortase K [Bacillota bacterium]